MFAVKKKAKRYCIAYGCLNSDRNEDISMFRLPADMERCKEWLALLNREDLLEKKTFHPPSYAVCEAHFADSSFKKGLKRGSTPVKVQLEQKQEGPYYEIEILPYPIQQESETASIETQTEPCGQSNKSTQTSECMTAPTQKRKPSKDINSQPGSPKATSKKKIRKT